MPDALEEMKVESSLVPAVTLQLQGQNHQHVWRLFFFFSVRRVTVSIRYLSSLFKLRGFLFSGVCLSLSETFQRHTFFFSNSPSQAFNFQVCASLLCVWPPLTPLQRDNRRFSAWPLWAQMEGLTVH